MAVIDAAVEILVVDDEPAVALAIKAALKFCGFAVRTVATGEAALEEVRTEPGRFPIILSDHNMPGLGGMALVRALQAIGYRGHILILSAFLSRDIEAQYQEIGVNQILSKPFDLQGLRLALDRILHPTECVS
jgi:DNA-binding response OmpR family regulator